MDEKKPGLAILIGHALAEKGKAKHDPLSEAPKDDGEAKDDGGLDEHVHMIAEDMIAAIHEKDVDKLADLLKEAFECMDDKLV
ncbi:MAG: hypothetical protein ABSB40_11990 [Nitrososphaeria archaeon]|jgi:hypothetical protein